MRRRFQVTRPVILWSVLALVLILIYLFVGPQTTNVVHVLAVPPALLLKNAEAEKAADSSFDYSAPIMRLNENPIEILLWNGGSWAGWGSWNQLSAPNYFTAVRPIQKGSCPIPCVFTTDRSRSGSADAIMYEVTVPFGLDGWIMDPPQVPEKMPHQTWLTYHYESPEYFPLMAQEPLRNLVEGDVSYNQDAWVHATFYCPFGSKMLDDILLPPPPKTDPNKLVIFITSNCHNGGASRRLAYVEELMRYIPVDSYGICLHNKETPDAHHMRQQRSLSHGDVMLRRIELVSQYKFGIAFENTDQSADYVTEKVWTTWAAGTVPIYWGAANIRQWLPGNDSIIDTASFSSPRALARYLRNLAADDKAYMQHFEWKKRPLNPGFTTLVDNCVVHADCKICKKLARARANHTALRPPPARLFAVRFGPGLPSIEVPPSAPLDLQEEFTIAAWIELDRFGSGARIVDKSMEGTISAYTFDILENWGRACLRLCAAGACHQSPWGVVHLNRWTHVAATFSLSAHLIRFFINGEQVGTAAVTKAAGVSQYPLSFGAPGVRLSGAGADVSLQGTLDAISLWKAPLDSAYLKRLMYRQPLPGEPNLVSFWGLDEGEGDIAKDIGPHQLHGRLKGGAHWVACPTRPLVGLGGAPAPKIPLELFYAGLAMGAVAGLAVVVLLVACLTCWLRSRASQPVRAREV